MNERNSPIMGSTKAWALPKAHKQMRGLCIPSFLGCLVGFLLCACQPSSQSDKESLWLATVDNQYLYLHDLRQQDPQQDPPHNPPYNQEEIQAQTKDWIIQQLIIKKAQDAPNINMKDLEHKVTSYRYALISHAVEKQYTQQHRQSVPPERLKAHYLKRKKDYMLQFPILRMAYLQVARTTPALSQYRQALLRYRKADKQRLIRDCVQKKLVCNMEDTLWRSIPEAMENIPFPVHQKLYEHMGEKPILEAQDERFVYLLRVLEYLPKGNIAPFAYVKHNIAQHMAIQQKKQLVKRMKEEIWEEAKQKNAFKTRY